jgi:hypothetical protein
VRHVAVEALPRVLAVQRALVLHPQRALLVVAHADDQARPLPRPLRLNIS